MLLFLSADEIGSMHERIKDLLKMGPWLSYLPFLIVLLGCCAWSFIQPVDHAVRADHACRGSSSDSPSW